jgi:hypothetical protein
LGYFITAFFVALSSRSTSIGQQATQMPQPLHFSLSKFLIAIVSLLKTLCLIIARLTGIFPYGGAPSNYL